MTIFLDQSDPVSLVAAVALREANTPYAWYSRPSESHASTDRATVVCGEVNDSDAPRIDCASLLQWLFPVASGQDPLHAAQVRTLLHSGMRLVRLLSMYVRGDPELPLTRNLSQVMTTLERIISGPVFAPERFTYVPAEYFDGQGTGSIDVVFASVFAIAGPALCTEIAGTRFPRTTAWRESLCHRVSVKTACAELFATEGRRLRKA